MDIIRPSIETKKLLDHYLQYNHYRGCEFSAANSLFWCDFYQTKFTILEDMLVSVSYTHLDVYKRQGE